MIKNDDPVSRNKWNDRRKAAIDSLIMKATTTSINQYYMPSNNNQTGVNKLESSLDNNNDNRDVFSRKILGALENNNQEDVPKKVNAFVDNVDATSRKIEKGSCRGNTLDNHGKDMLGNDMKVSMEDMTISKSPKSIGGNKKHASDKMKNISSILNIKDAQESRSKRFLIANKKNRAHRRLQICLTLKNLDDMKEEMSIVLDNAKRKRIKYAQQSK